MDRYWCYNEETTFGTIFCARAFVLRLTLPRFSLIEPLPSGAQGVMGRTEESVRKAIFSSHYPCLHRARYKDD